MAQVLVPILDAGTRRLAAGQLPIAEVGEISRDAVGAALRTTGPANITVDDGGETITINVTATTNATDASLRARANHTGFQEAATISDLTEVVEDIVAAVFGRGAHTNITVTYADNGTGLGAISLTGSAGGGTGTLDAEGTRDTIKAALRGVDGVDVGKVTTDDASDTLTIGLTNVPMTAIAGLQAALDLKLEDVSAVDITDSTPVGRNILTAADAAAVRSTLNVGGLIAGTRRVVYQDFTSASTARAAGTDTTVVTIWSGPVQPTNMVGSDRWEIVG